MSKRGSMICPCTPKAPPLRGGGGPRGTGMESRWDLLLGLASSVCCQFPPAFHDIMPRLVRLCDSQQPACERVRPRRPRSWLVGPGVRSPLERACSRRALRTNGEPWIWYSSRTKSLCLSHSRLVRNFEQPEPPTWRHARPCALDSGSFFAAGPKSTPRAPFGHAQEGSPCFGRCAPSRYTVINPTVP